MKTVITVEGMQCEHCAKAIQNELMELQGIENVEVNLEKKQVTILHEESVRMDTIKNMIQELGYEVIG